MTNKQRTSLWLATLAFGVPLRVLAAGETETDGGILPPVVRDMMVILMVVMCILLFIGVAVAIMTARSAGKNNAKFDKLNRTVRSLSDDVGYLKKTLALDPDDAPAAVSPFLEPPPAPAGGGVRSAEWQEFVGDYNNLARSVDVPRFEQACKNFVELHEIRLLVCLSPSGIDANGMEQPPRFASVNDGESDFWAWPIPNYKSKFAVVPDPTISYDEKLHMEGGMKETFASNYDSGIYRHVEVKIPAIFSHKNDKWSIEQPGLIRLGDG